MSAADAALSWPTVTRLAPLSRLSQDSLLELQRTALLGELAPGQDLFRRGSSDGFDYYLVNGTVELFGDGIGARSLSGSGQGSLQRIGAERPRPVTARAQTRVHFLRVQAGLLDLLMNGDGRAGYTVQEYRPDDEDAENRLLFQVYQAYAEDRLELPAVPELGERIRRAVEDPNVGAGEVAKIVQADPGVAARLVRVANSALYSGSSPVRSLREAVVRLGLTSTRDLVVAFTMQNLFSPSDAGLRRKLLDVWRHSTFVAAVSHTLARRLRAADPDRALLGGLLHDIGAALLITHAEVFPEVSGDPERLDRVITGLRGEVGALVLGRWGFQDDLVTTARECESWLRDPGPRADLCDVVLVSQLYALRSAGAVPATLPELTSVPAFARLGMAGAQAMDVASMLDDAQKEIADLRRLLLG